MLGAIKIMVDGTWSILQNIIPIDEFINFSIWQFYMFVIITGVLLRALFVWSLGFGTGSQVKYDKRGGKP